MDREIIVQLRTSFDDMAQNHPETGIEYWRARDLQMLLGYAQWRSFESVIERAITSCQKSGYDPCDHFARERKMVDIGSGSRREVEDIALTRYACYLIAQNGDPSKEPIAFAQTYFAVQTRKQELIEQRLAEQERISARKKLTRSEKELSGIIFERVGDEGSFARIRSKGDTALFGGITTRDMKNRLNVPQARPLADFLPTISIKAKDFANEITNINIKSNDLRTEPAITDEHVSNNKVVRALLVDRGITPERLPAAEDAKKVERRLLSTAKKLAIQPKNTEGTELPPQQ